ncbi:MAG: hypothetical protein QXM31_03890 [Candidatus Woesearchaeota archaeon]
MPKYSNNYCRIYVAKQTREEIIQGQPRIYITDLENQIIPGRSEAFFKHDSDGKKRIMKELKPGQKAAILPLDQNITPLHMEITIGEVYRITGAQYEHLLCVVEAGRAAYEDAKARLTGSYQERIEQLRAQLAKLENEMRGQVNSLQRPLSLEDTLRSYVSCACRQKFREASLCHSDKALQEYFCRTKKR